MRGYDIFIICYYLVSIFLDIPIRRVWGCSCAAWHRYQDVFRQYDNAILFSEHTWELSLLFQTHDVELLWCGVGQSVCVGGRRRRG